MFHDDFRKLLGVQSRLNLSLDVSSVFFAEADMGSHELSVTVDDVTGGHAFDLIRFRKRAFGVKTDLEICRDFLEELVGLLGIAVEVHGDDDQSAVGELSMEIIHPWKRFLAGFAPRSPKVEIDDFAGELFEGDVTFFGEYFERSGIGGIESRARCQK